MIFESLVIKRYQWCSSRGDAAFIFIVSFSTGEATKKNADSPLLQGQNCQFQK